MINPPVSLFASVGRLDKLFAASIGTGDDANRNTLSKAVRTNSRICTGRPIECKSTRDFLLGAAAIVLRTDEEFSAAIALAFRLDLVDMFFAGDLYAAPASSSIRTTRPG